MAGKPPTGPGPEADTTSGRLVTTGSLRPHPEAGRVPRMDAVAYPAFAADVVKRGVLVPLDVNADGVVLDGHERLRAACEGGFERVSVRVVAPPDEVEYMLE